MRPGFQTVGQITARRIGLRTVTQQRVGQPLLVHGARGSGKDAFVADLVATLLCEALDPQIGPCNACRSCRRARAGTHSDVVIASPESWRTARQGGESIVAVTRRWLLDTASTPVEGERRIAVIRDAERATEQSQNALLKALEEPSPRHVFILVADDVERLLPTIRSRCQQLRIGAVPRADLAGWLVERFSITDGQADALALMSRGRIGLAARLAERPALVAWQRGLQGELLTLVGRGRAERFGSAKDAIAEALKVLDEVPEVADLDGEPATASEERADARTPAARQRAAAIAVVDVWRGLARDLLVAAAGRPEVAVGTDVLPELPAMATLIGPAPIVRFIGRLEEIREGLVQNASARLALEVAMLEWPSLDPVAA